MDKAYNCCPYCHARDTIKVEAVEPSTSMDDAITMRFKCKTCKKTYETDYINSIDIVKN